MRFVAFLLLLLWQKGKRHCHWIIYPMAVGPLTAHSLRGERLSPVPMVSSKLRAYTPALQLGTLNDVGGRPHLLLFASLTHFSHELLEIL